MRVFASMLMALLVAGCTGTAATAVDATGAATAQPTADVPASTATPSPTRAPTATAAPTVAPTSAPTATVTPQPTELPTAAATATPPRTPTTAPTPTATVAPTSTPQPSATPFPARTPDPDKTLEPVDYRGDIKAIRTASGVVVPVRSAGNGTFEVVTPCYNIATIRGGLPITGPLDVLIDPGHGGEETGAVGPNGLIEATVNLQVAEELRAELQERGYSVELTRYGDHRMAVQARTELANALAPRIFMSVHHNGGYPTEFPVAATEVFVQQDDLESRRLGGLVFEELQAAFAGIDIDWMGNLESFGVAWRQNREGTDLYGILRRTPGLVTVLTEAMFISTPAEAELLAKPETITTEALALAEAVDEAAAGL